MTLFDHNIVILGNYMPQLNHLIRLLILFLIVAQLLYNLNIVNL